MFNFLNKPRLVKKELENKLISCMSSGRHRIGKSPVNTRNVGILKYNSCRTLYGYYEKQAQAEDESMH